MTTIFPVIFGWIAQKYSTVPAVESVCENLSLVSRALEWNFPSLSVTKCGMSSALTQVTVVPTLTVKVGGSKVKLAIFMVWSSASARPPLAHKKQQHQRIRTIDSMVAIGTSL